MNDFFSKQRSSQVSPASPFKFQYLVCIISKSGTVYANYVIKNENLEQESEKNMKNCENKQTVNIYR